MSAEYWVLGANYEPGFHPEARLPVREGFIPSRKSAVFRELTSGNKSRPYKFRESPDEHKLIFRQIKR